MRESILIIDDNEDIRENTAELLTLDGFVVTMAGSGEAALKLLEYYCPDLIICDILMCGMSGYDVYAALKFNKITSSIPFLFSTAQSEKKDRRKASEIGVEHYLIKPFDEIQLLASIRSCLGIKLNC